MEYSKIGDWAIGYLEALSTGNSISKQQLLKMIDRIQEMINEIESSSAINRDLPGVNDEEDF